MTDEEKKAIENVKKQLEGIKKANECGLATKNEFKEDIESIETVLNLIQKQQAELEYYKKQKKYDEQFKHELLEEIRCKGLTIDNLNKILDDRLICIQGGRGLYAKLKGLDKEYLIREYLLMYKMNKAELEKKDKIIDEMAIFLANLDTDENICKHQVAEFCEGTDGVSLDICVKCIKKYFEKKVEENEYEK